MANCSGTTSVSSKAGCYSNCGAPAVSQTNCGCTPCTAPVIVQGDLNNQVLVPVLADVIQNCVTVNRCETGYPDELVIETNLLKAGVAGVQPIPSGTICITDVSYSYSCIGVPGVDGTATEVGASTPIDAVVGCKPVSLTSTTPSCICTNLDGNLVGIYNDYSGIAKTGTCCCNQVAQAYSQTKIVEKQVPLSICNLNISVKGTIGGQEFTGRVVGINNAGAIDEFPNPTPTNDLGFPETINFCEIMCLPTSTRLTINESFDNCLAIDCIRPNNATYTAAEDTITGGTADNAKFVASADLSLIISKNVFATTSEKLAVLSSADAQVVCSDNLTPTCPSTSQCSSPTPCPGPAEI